MNRSQRREYARKTKGRYFLDIADSEGAVKPGEEMTIAGVRMLEAGGYIIDCDPGKETVFITKDSRLPYGGIR